MHSVTLVDATDLVTWANRRDAQALLPQLLRRLVHATVKRVLRVGFPASEGVQLGGWDGIVAVEEGNAFVPDGTSAWELGANKDVKGKADNDYEKRHKDPRGVDPARSAFVFVTPRRWSGKNDWVAARQGEGVWREVHAYDADNLETWLELAPAVHIWLSILLGKHPESAMDLENFWADWSETTRPATTPEFVLSGRGEVVERVHAWLRDPSTPLALQAESRDEALAVFAAALEQLPPEEGVPNLSRAAVVRDLSAWHRLTTSDEPLILVQAFDSRDAIARATRTGHRVVVPLGRADSAAAATLTVPRLSREEAAKALVACGIAEDRAHDLAVLARRSLMSFRRKLALSPEVQRPEWARPSEAHPLLPAMLAGAWSDAMDGDRQTIATLAQAPYEEVSEILVRWSNESDPPIRHVGDTWFIVSKEDAWSLLSRYLTRDDLERFEEVAIDVLGTPDPRFDLPDDQQWMAGALGHAPRYSRSLREGLADTLAIMGAHGDTTPLSAGISAREYSTRIVRRLLECANADWRVWASLSHSHSLSLLAEAAPDAFLAAVEEGLAGQQPVLLNLFPERENQLFSSSPHTGLLWALETLAWSPDHLGHVGLVLAKLARLDPVEKLRNRPQNSLREIFLLWHPQTMATLEQRLHVLDAMLHREPEVAWRLLHQLLPEHHGVAHNTPTPRWREWAPDSPPRVMHGEYIRAVREVATLMLADAGGSGSRWQDLIEALSTLPVDQHEAIVERLANMDPKHLQPSDCAAIWDALRKLISKHRSFPDAGWALPRERVDRLEEIYRRFEPQELAARYGWLFGDSPALPEGREGDWGAHQEAVASARLDAVRAVHARAGLAGLLELIGRVKRSSDLGTTLGRSEFLESEEDKLLREHLGANDVGRTQFARGFVTGRVGSRGREWVEAKLADVTKVWSPAQRAELLACLPHDGRTWDLAEGADMETERRYWRLVYPYGIGDSGDVERAARKFLEHGRPYTAVELLALHATREHAPPAVLIADALERALQTSPQDDPPTNFFSHHVSELLDVLVASEGINENRIAALEWAFLPLLGMHERTPKLLHRELVRNPDFFAQIVALVFHAEGEEPREVSEEEQVRARHGYELLDSWRSVPGTADDGTISADTLRDWVQRARAVIAASGREAIGDEKIGRVLSGSPTGLDGAWPHPAVRDVIENVSSTALERGFEVGLYNSRGVVTKHPFEGGVQERQLADRYADFAAAVGDRWPRTAVMLRRIADGYRAEALREDQEAELREDLGR